jgi:hypothetical protein
MNWDKEKEVSKLLRYVYRTKERHVSYILHFGRFDFIKKLRKFLICCVREVEILKDSSVFQRYLNLAERGKFFQFQRGFMWGGHENLCWFLYRNIQYISEWRIPIILQRIRENSESRLKTVKFQLDLVKDIFPPPINRWFDIRQWNNGTVEKIAKVIKKEKSYKDMPILADALEEAGCQNELILNHCRHRKSHYNGCFILDELII